MKKYSGYIPLTLFLVFAFIIYWFTKPPSILWIDSGTMIAASASLGIPNPPGFPFYMMASHVATILPVFANILTRLEFFTIIFSILLLFVVYKTIELILKNYFSETVHSSQFIVRSLTPLFGTIALAFSYQYWSQTQNTEAFIFSYFFVALFAYFMLKIEIVRKKFKEKEIGFPIYEKTVFKFLAITAFLYGLAAGANPTVSGMIPGVLYTMYINRRALNIQKVLTLGVTFAVVLAAVYSYLPIRASTWPFVNWGNPQTVELFIGHLHGAGLNINEPGPSGSINGFTGSPLVFAKSISYFLINTFLQFTPILWPLIIFGMVKIFKRSRSLFILLISVPVFNAVYSGIYLSGNQESWFILSWIFFAIFIAFGFYHFASVILSSTENLDSRIRGNDKMRGGNDRTRWKLFALFAASFIPLVVFFIPLNRSWHHYSADYEYNLYSPLEKDAILIGTGDFFDSVSHYTHSADVYRPDVTPLTANVFYVNKWNRDTIRHATNLSVSDKLEQMIQYKTYTEYNEVMNQFITENIDKHPIYVTHLTLRASALAGTTAGQLKLDDRYKFIPNGLTLKVVKKDSPTAPDMKTFSYKFQTPLSKIPFYLERNYKGAYGNILNDYIEGYEALGDWYAENKDDAKALETYQIASGLSEKNAEVYAHIADFYATRGDNNAAFQYYEKAQRFDVNNVGIHYNLGVVYNNLGRTKEAIQQLESVKTLSRPDEDVYKEADKLIAQFNVASLDSPKFEEDTAGWQRVKDDKNNFSLKIPPEFEKRSKDGDYATLISDNQPGSLGLVLEIVGEPISSNESIDDSLKKSKLILPGTLLDIQRLNFSGYIAAVQVYGTQTGDSTQRFIFAKNGWMWQIKVSPGNSAKLSQVYPILSTFQPGRLK